MAYRCKLNSARECDGCMDCEDLDAFPEETGRYEYYGRYDDDEDEDEEDPEDEPRKGPSKL